jgi:hypothetical protein
MEAKKVMTRGRRSKNEGRAEKKLLQLNRGLKSRVNPIKRRSEFIDCTACNIKRIEAIYTLLLENLVSLYPFKRISVGSHVRVDFICLCHVACQSKFTLQNMQTTRIQCFQ